MASTHQNELVDTDDFDLESDLDVDDEINVEKYSDKQIYKHLKTEQDLKKGENDRTPLMGGNRGAKSSCYNHEFKGSRVMSISTQCLIFMSSGTGLELCLMTMPYEFALLDMDHMAGDLIICRDLVSGSIGCGFVDYVAQSFIQDIAATGFYGVKFATISSKVVIVSKDNKSIMLKSLIEGLNWEDPKINTQLLVGLLETRGRIDKVAIILDKSTNNFVIVWYDMSSQALQLEPWHLIGPLEPLIIRNKFLSVFPIRGRIIILSIGWAISSILERGSISIIMAIISIGLIILIFWLSTKEIVCEYTVGEYPCYRWTGVDLFRIKFRQEMGSFDVGVGVSEHKHHLSQDRSIRTSPEGLWFNYRCMRSSSSSTYEVASSHERLDPSTDGFVCDLELVNNLTNIGTNCLLDTSWRSHNFINVKANESTFRDLYQYATVSYSVQDHRSSIVIAYTALSCVLNRSFQFNLSQYEWRFSQFNYCLKHPSLMASAKRIIGSLRAYKQGSIKHIIEALSMLPPQTNLPAPIIELYAIYLVTGNVGKKHFISRETYKQAEGDPKRIIESCIGRHIQTSVYESLINEVGVIDTLSHYHHDTVIDRTTSYQHVTRENLILAFTIADDGSNSNHSATDLKLLEELLNIKPWLPAITIFAITLIMLVLMFSWSIHSVVKSILLAASLLARRFNTNASLIIKAKLPTRWSCCTECIIEVFSWLWLALVVIATSLDSVILLSIWSTGAIAMATYEIWWLYHNYYNLGSSRKFWRSLFDWEEAKDAARCKNYDPILKCLHDHARPQCWEPVLETMLMKMSGKTSVADG